MKLSPLMLGTLLSYATGIQAQEQSDSLTKTTNRTLENQVQKKKLQDTKDGSEQHRKFLRRKLRSDRCPTCGMG